MSDQPAARLPDLFAARRRGQFFDKSQTANAGRGNDGACLLSAKGRKPAKWCNRGVAPLARLLSQSKGAEAGERYGRERKEFEFLDSYGSDR